MSKGEVLDRPTQAVNMERTGEETFTIEHDDGSQYDMKGKWPEQLKGQLKVAPPRNKNHFCMGASFDKNGNLIR